MLPAGPRRTPVAAAIVLLAIGAIANVFPAGPFRGSGGGRRGTSPTSQFPAWPGRGPPHRSSGSPAPLSAPAVGSAVVGCSATHPGRADTFRRAVESWAPQVDRGFVYLNLHSEVPAWLAEYAPKVVAVLPGNSSARPWNLRDGAKFHCLSAGLAPQDAYVLSLDDDIVYPKDYALRMVAAVDRHGRKAVVGTYGSFLRADLQGFRFRHGCNLDLEDIRSLAAVRNKTDHLRSKAFGTPCSRATVREYLPVPCDAPVDVLGTATTAFHRSLLPDLSPADFAHPVSLADLALSGHAKARGVPMVLAARPMGWLGFLPERKPSAYSEMMEDDTVQTRFVMERAPWLLGGGADPGEALRGRCDGSLDGSDWDGEGTSTPDPGG
ncbi:hypothetical protein DFJ74DRAFT_712030 [Hyaloraphidium curvatum]|nr:hypothetical protein DFJ74DRAFT_712030 [Hyaloraphidium curvatum]